MFFKNQNIYQFLNFQKYLFIKILFKTALLTSLLLLIVNTGYQIFGQWLNEIIKLTCGYLYIYYHFSHLLTMKTEQKSQFLGILLDFARSLAAKNVADFEKVISFS